MSRQLVALASALLVLGLAACDRTPEPLAPQSTRPEATSAVSAARLFEWALNQEEADALDGLLSADFVFVAASLDSAGNPALASMPRESLMLAFRSMFEGVLGRSAPASVDFGLDHNLLEFPDDRPGRTAEVHRSLRSSCDLSVVDPTAQGSFNVVGHLVFYVSRADSASRPPGGAALGHTGQWWITRIEDEAGAFYGALNTGAHPASNATLWSVLQFYLERARD